MSEKQIDFEKIDSNFKVETEVGEADVCFHDVRKKPFSIYGLYNPCGEPEFKRLPDALGTAVNDGVRALYTNTAGGRIRFSTDSRYVALHAVMPGGFQRFSHMPLTGGSGLDLFIDDPTTGQSRFCRTFIPPLKATDGFVGKVVFPNRVMRHFTLCMPSYNNLKDLYIGLQKDAHLGEGMPYANLPPIVFYGSSITQGGCASRPGNAYVNVISRRLNRDVINLGFSGSGKGEDNIVDYMAGLSMSVFVSDYDHNAPDAQHLLATHLKMYQKIRAAHPDIPYIMISKPDFNNAQTSLTGNIDCRNVIIDTYRYAYEYGDKNVYFIDGESLFCGPYEDMCTVDGTHPNDLGFALMADKIEQTIRRATLQQLIFNQK